ncbi:two-component regulator propeller domain-containing protein [Flavitalea sp. BT771]|uniref:ligand-binding sensor domain-containing protein n=1 Tax=Flavitalea sp. BT771 TaxID=3063329 RepID=UPI0026E1826D|nr:sensor histidine kinase [Flavitalea sp. BT771]MDV6220832.1 two-component regulator propeller domain-containing protein [Flavitalea sp. BT771]
MRNATILSTLLLVIVCHCPTNAQPYYFRHYQVENGLSNSTVFCSVQDKNGFLWFGTKEGLNRFDGYHFKLFTYTPGNRTTLGSDMIYCLFNDAGGTLWAGGQNGLFIFSQQQEKLVRVIDSLDEINWIQTDDKGSLWFLSRNNVYRYNLLTRQLKHFPEAQYFYATSICKTEDGTMWFTSNNGLVEKFNEGAENFTSYDLFSHSPQPSSRWLGRIRYAGKGRFLIGTTDQGLKSFDAATGDYKDLLSYNPDKTTIYVRDIMQYSGDEYWLGTESGVFILNISTGQATNLRKKFLDPYSLSDNAVYSLCKDSEGGVWVGTYFGGINYYSKQYSSFQKYYPDNSKTSISGSAPREICQDPNGNIWVGTEDAGLNKIDGKTGAITHFMPTGAATDIAYTNIHGLLSLGNELWIGTFEHGLDVMDIRTGKVIRHYMAGPRPNDLKSNFVLSIIRTRSGKLVLATSNGVYWYNERTNDFTPLPGIPPHTFVAIVVEDHDGVIWSGSHGAGVFYFNPFSGATGHIQGNATDGKGLSSSMLNAIAEDSDHNMWFSTEGGGLCRLGADRKTFFTYTTASGLPSNFIFRFIQDDNKDYWVTTSKGLANISRKDNTVKVYTRANGLLNDQFNYNSGFKDKDGKLYFGGVRGLITFFPNDFALGGFTPSVFITGFQVDNVELKISQDSSYLKKSIIYTDRIALPYDQSSFSIDFAALSYAAPERTEYSYFMQGLDKAWTHLSTNRKVYFTNLAPGAYTFRLKAAVGGHWGDKEKELSIEVLPPFWATGWAWSFYGLLVILLVWYIVRSYHRRTQIKKEKEIYEAKFDFFTNIAHEIRTPLTLIKGPAENLREMIDQLPEIKEDVITMERNTNRLIALVTQILDFRQTETRGFRLDFTRVNITEVLQENYLSFNAMAKKKNLAYHFEHPAADVFAMADEEALNKIFSNLFSNAVKYGQAQVFVRLLPPTNEEGNIIIEIANDGPVIPQEQKERIFEPFYRLKETIRQKGTGIGLALARSLVELHKGQLFLDDSWPGMNKFKLILPINK